MNSDAIAHCLAARLFKSDLVVLDRCTWPGSECDLLAVTPRLQVIDCEIKISRADLKVDRHKSKWFMEPDFLWRGEHGPPMPKHLPREWPQKVWKHYYALPHSLWKPELAKFCKPTSGIILVDYCDPITGLSESYRAKKANKSPALWWHKVVKRAKPNPDYLPLGPREVRKLAYLASVRMWEAYWQLERMQRDREQMTATAAGSAA
jgi:hypothetical protein